MLSSYERIRRHKKACQASSSSYLLLELNTYSHNYIIFKGWFALSRLRCPNGDDHPDAAGKHLDDALILMHNGRFDGAAYLSGYVVECSLKTLIILQTKKSEIGHNLDKLSKKALEFAGMPTSKTARYNKIIKDKLAIGDPNNGWKETMRYCAPNRLSPDEARIWVEEAKRVYESTVVQMKKDGVL